MIRPWRSWSLRVRLTALSILSAGLILAIGWLALLAALHSYLIRTADGSALESAESIAEQVRDGSLPEEFLVTEEITTTAQVVQNGRVISATSNAVGDLPFAYRFQSPGEHVTFGMDKLVYDKDGPFRVAALGVASPRGAVTVLVAVDAEDAYDELEVAAKVGALAGLAILAVLGAMLRIVIGRSLAPVAEIRRRADSISGKGLHLRVPVPVRDDEISALASTINAMLARIESSVRRQDAFVADAAHELRTPLATLRARIEVDQMRAESVDSELFAQLLGDVDRMSELVDQLLLLARSEVSLVGADLEPVDVDDLVVRAAANFDHRTVHLEVQPVTPVQIRGQLTLLQQVLPNLLANAARYAHARVEVSVETDDEWVAVVVDDDGPGIPAADRERVFERFIRLDDSRERGTGGYGLGLAIVAQIVEMNHGRVTAEASPLGGARIRVELPREQPLPTPASI